MSSGILQSSFRPPVIGTGAPFGAQPPFNTAAPFGVSVPGLSTRGILPGGQVGAPGFSSFIGGSAFGDADPISPGVQAQPGVLTATGPSTVVGGGFGGVGATTFGGNVGAFGTSFNAFNRGGVVDADPFTPGIQSQPGVVTQVGPSRVVGGGAYGVGVARTSGGIYSSGVAGVGAVGGFNRGFGGVVDADPFTPGVQSQPGTVTAVGPSRVVGGPGYGVGVGVNQTGYGVGVGGIQTSNIGSFNRGSVGFGGVVDADPLTPGIQAQPGVITATGAPRVVSTGSGISGAFGSIGGAITGAVGAIGGALGITNSGRGQPVVYDADPITPGIQANAGTVTAVGPSVVVGQSGGVNVSGIRSAAVYDADPFTPGIQAQPGIITATGPSTGGGMLSSGAFGGFGGGIVDADPFTPGIQAQPGTVTVTGPTTTVSSINQGGILTSGVYGQTFQTNTVQHHVTPMLGSVGNVGILNSGGNYQRGIVGGVDLDPITPGYQTGPGLVTQTGPSRVIGRVGQSCFDCCPWWLWTLLGLLLLGALLGGLYALFKPKTTYEDDEVIDDETTIIHRGGRRNTTRDEEKDIGTKEEDKNKTVVPVVPVTPEEPKPVTPEPVKP